MIQMPVSVISEDQGQCKTNKRRRTYEVAQFALSCAKHHRRWALPDCMKPEVHSYILVIKQTRCANFSNFIFGIKLYMFRTVPLSIIRSFSPYTQQWYVSSNLYHVYHCCVYSEKTPDDGHKNCPKHAEFYSENKIWEISASSWFFYKNLSRCAVTWTSNTRSTVVVTSKQ